MRNILVSLFFLSLTTSFGQNFDSFLDSEKLALATTKPIVVRLLDENDENSAIYNPNIKKYAEEFFGKERIKKYLVGKEFINFVTSKKYKEKYNFIGTYNNKSIKPGEMLLYYGLCGYKIDYNAYFLVEDFDFKEKQKFYLITEADIKFTLSLFKLKMQFALENNFESYKEYKKAFVENAMNKSPKKLNPNAMELKDLTLLVDKDLADENTTDYFNSNYKYKIEIVDKSRIDEAILNNEKGIAFLFNHDKCIYKTEDLSRLYEYLYVPVMGYGVHFFPSKEGFKIDLDQYIKTLHSAIE
ncbi:hypothetical protein [Flavobacterium sp. U410]